MCGGDAATYQITLATCFVNCFGHKKKVAHRTANASDFIYNPLVRNRKPWLEIAPTTFLLTYGLKFLYVEIRRSLP